ncbi:MAG: helix-turn-helix transcriptional regulator [Nitriliruptoraceae bacterium]
MSDVGRGRQEPPTVGSGADPGASPAQPSAPVSEPSAAGPETDTAHDGTAPAGSSAEGAAATRPPEDHASPLDELGSYIRHQRESAALSLRKLAKIAGVSNPYLSQIERGLRKPSAEILQAIAKALEISSETLYVKAGILDEREIVVDVEVAVAADPHLTGPQRQALLEMYRSFRRLSELQEPRPSRRRQLLDALTPGDVDDEAIRAAGPPQTADEA